MSWMIGSGVGLALIGLLGIIWSVIMVIKARRAGLDDEALRAALAKVIPVNLAALMVSVLGLIIVVIATKMAG